MYLFFHYHAWLWKDQDCDDSSKRFFRDDIPCAISPPPPTFLACTHTLLVSAMFAPVAAFALLASASAVAPFHRGNGDVIPGEYMVVFQKDSAPADREAHINKIKV